MPSRLGTSPGNDCRPIPVGCLLVLLLHAAGSTATAQVARGLAGGAASYGGAANRAAMPVHRPAAMPSAYPNRMSRPVTPNIGMATRPSPSRPVGGNPTANIPRPRPGGSGSGNNYNPGGIVSGGATSRPGMINPGMTRPSQLPNRPLSPPVARPTPSPRPNPPTRPTPLPNPSPGPIRPSPPNLGVGRPTKPIDPPTTLPSIRPGDRPGLIARPDRPMPLPSRPMPLPERPTRPVPLPDRPSLGNLPQIKPRPPLTDLPTTLPARPLPEVLPPYVRPPYPGVRPPNRPGWGWGWNGYPFWHQYWIVTFIPPYNHGWYHGCWHGDQWNDYFALQNQGSAWGLNRYGPVGGYANPYLMQSVPAPYLEYYSQPISITKNQEGQESSTADIQAIFEQARQQFQAGDYARAQALSEQALADRPDDPSLHEFHALTLFMNDDYQRAAVVLNSLLASAPGWDWTTMIGLYGEPDAYTRQLRKLEAHCKANPKDAAAIFVLSYHYIICGELKAARSGLRKLLALQPSDNVAARLLAALEPPAATLDDPVQATAPNSSPSSIPAVTPSSTPADRLTTTQRGVALTGQWIATNEADQVLLDLRSDGSFAWQLTADGKTAKMEGTWSVGGDYLVLVSETDGSLVGEVSPDQAGSFRLKWLGSPDKDAGLLFRQSP